MIIGKGYETANERMRAGVRREWGSQTSGGGNFGGAIFALHDLPTDGQQEQHGGPAVVGFGDYLQGPRNAVVLRGAVLERHITHIERGDVSSSSDRQVNFIFNDGVFVGRLVRAHQAILLFVD